MTGWRGAEYEGEFPTLGYDVGEWIESNLIVPDGYLMGQPYLLTDEMWQFLLHYYRVDPTLTRTHHDNGRPVSGLVHYGAQLRRSQKWGKDPFGAAISVAEALGPTRFDGWSAGGEPVGRPYPTPLIVCLGTSEDQTANTWDPVLAMIQQGPLGSLPGVDAGQTRIILPGGGRMEPATSSSRARLGGRMTFVTLTESHLWTAGGLANGGYRKLASNVKRNVSGMGGRWIELTNAWDPTEGSEAQVTAESDNHRVYIDTVMPRRVENLDDDEELYAELLRQYGDSALENGGWVDIRGRIFDEVRNSAHMESDRRRFYLNEIVVGESAFVNAVIWDDMAGPESLAPDEPIVLGMDGAKYRDATALVASRLSDGKLFLLGLWRRPADAGPDWTVNRSEVDAVVRSAFTAYRVVLMFADPWHWETYLDAWSNSWPDKIVEFPTNQEQRMDKAINRFVTDFANLEVSHDGSELLTEHVRNCVLIKGSRKRQRAGDDETLSTHYYKMAKRAAGKLIDAAVAAVLAHEARGYAVENGMTPAEIIVPWALFD